MAAAESYPDDLRYHPEHDWARIDGDEATLGITWFAQDALGELVHFEAPEEGATLTKDQSYGEVESVKAVSDVIAPLSGEVLEVNQRRRRRARDRERRSVRRGLARPRSALTDPAEVDALLDAEAYKQHLAEQRVSYLALTDADREAMLADDRRLLGRGALRATSRPACASGASSTSSRRSPSRS